MAIRISAIICTYNRVEVLPTAIESLIHQTLPASEYEILIIDNASSDNTAQMIKEKFAHIPNLRYIFDPMIGVSQARNTGWQSAHGEYIAYIDDDAIADTNFLSNIIHTFETVQPKPGVIAGKIIPLWKSPKPAWLSNQCLSNLGTLDISETPRFLTETEWVVGANMSFPRSVLEQTKGFCTLLGRKGKIPLFAEEEDMSFQILQLGYRGYYDPQILVSHQISPHRLTYQWFYHSYFWHGVSNAICYMRKKHPSFCRSFLQGLYLFLRHAFSPYYIYVIWIIPNSPRYFEKRLVYWSMLGYALYMLRIIRIH